MLLFKKALIFNFNSCQAFALRDQKSQDKNLNILKMKKAFNMK